VKKQFLMTTVSTFALTSGLAGIALADDAAPNVDPKFSLTLEGGFGRLDSAPKDKWGAESGGFDDKAGVGQDMAYTGAISLSRSIGENRDVRFGLGFGGNPSNISSDSSGYSAGTFVFPGSGDATVSVSNDFGFTSLDIDTGRSTAMSLGNLTAFGGLRGLVTTSASTSSTDKIGNDTSIGGLGQYTAQIAVNNESNFVGLGPRLGVGFASKPIAGGFGFSGEMAGGLVYGQRTDSASVDKAGTSEFTSGSGSATVAQSESNSQIIKTLDVKASLDYHVSENATLSLGYQARQFWNVDSFSDPDGGTVNNRLVDGAFIAFTTKF